MAENGIGVHQPNNLMPDNRDHVVKDEFSDKSRFGIRCSDTTMVLTSYNEDPH